MAKRADVPEFGMLRGVTVVNASTVVAGPIAASLMAEMGADVIWIDTMELIKRRAADIQQLFSLSIKQFNILSNANYIIQIEYNYGYFSINIVKAMFDSTV